MPSTVSALAISFAQNQLLLLVQIVSNLVLARLLSPAEIGVYSVSAALFGIAHTMRDFGMGQYVVQEKNLSLERIQAAFTVTLTLAVILACAAWGLRGFVARYYGQAGINDVMMVMGFNLLLVPFGAMSMAVLRREMRFGPVAVVNILDGLAGSVTSVVMAFIGFSYMSLAWAGLASAGVTLLASLMFRPPGLPWLPRFTGLGPALKFGSRYLASTIVVTLSGAAPNLMLGRLIGVRAVALFSKATGTADMFHTLIMNAVWNMALPHFAKVSRTGGDVGGEFLRASSYITCVAMPFFATLAILSYPVVRSLFGDQWDEAVPLIKWVCLAFAVISPYYVFASALIAVGQIRWVTRIEGFGLVLMVSALAISAPYGLFAVGGAWAAATILKAPLMHFALVRYCGMSTSGLMSSLVPSIVIGAITAAGALAATTLSPPGPANRVVPLLLGGALACGGWVVGILVTRHPIREHALGALRSFWGRVFPA